MRQRSMEWFVVHCFVCGGSNSFAVFALATSISVTREGGDGMLKASSS
jgi:hypothetical protein